MLMHISKANILEMMTHTGKTLLLLSKMKSCSGFRLICVPLNLTHSNGQGHGHARLDSKYLGNGEIYENRNNCNYWGVD